ncbi:hypothetical protein CHS0354_014734, partial [Potamilus streckersoni]
MENESNGSEISYRITAARYFESRNQRQSSTTYYTNLDLPSHNAQADLEQLVDRRFPSRG